MSSTGAAAPASASSLDSIISDPECIEKWRRLSDSHPLAQLHAKFWGKDLAEEEEAWRAKQQSTSDPSDDESEDDDDITSGCYVLDIDNYDMSMKSIWVRADYIRIYDFLVDYYNKKARHGRGMVPAAVITGQFGIGKSMWIDYALCRCLAEKRPVIWSYYRHPVMFAEGGAYCMEAQFASQFAEAEYKSVPWALVDADIFWGGIPEDIVRQNKRFFGIYVSDLPKEDWSCLQKAVPVKVVVMNPWTRSEIHQAAQLNGCSPGSNIINDTYDEFGLTPRLCSDMASDPHTTLKEYKEKIRRAEMRVSLQNVRRVIDELEEDLNLDKDMEVIFEELLTIRRSDIHNVESKIHVAPITERLRSRLASAMEIDD